MKPPLESSKRTPLPRNAIVAAVALFLAAAFAIPVFGAPVVLNGIRAVVNGEPITQNMVDQAFRTQVQVWHMGNKGMVTREEAAREIRKMEERALNDLIDRNLILSEFKKRQGQIKDQFVDEAVNTFIKDRFGGDRNKFMAELREAGMTIAQFREVQREQIAIQALRHQNAGDAVIPNTPWEKRKKYDEIKGQHASEGQVKLRIISIPKQTPDSSQEQQRAVLNSVLSSLRNGGDFGALAKQHSDDSFASKGGYVGVISRSGPLNQGLTQMAYSLPAGRVSDALDDGPYWRILKVEERVGQRVPSFADLEEEIDRILTIEKRQKALETWLAKLRRDANVRLYDN